jgi:hypothetical protein
MLTEGFIFFISKVTDFLRVFLPITLVRTLSTTLCSLGDSEHPCFVLITGKVSVLYCRVFLAVSNHVGEVFFHSSF